MLFLAIHELPLSSCKALYTSKKTAKDIPKYFREFEGHKGRNWGAKIEQECTKSDSRALSLVYIGVLHDLFHQSDYLGGLDHDFFGQALHFTMNELTLHVGNLL
jgi:hypothetical protein